MQNLKFFNNSRANLENLDSKATCKAIASALFSLTNLQPYGGCTCYFGAKNKNSVYTLEPCYYNCGGIAYVYFYAVKNSDGNRKNLRDFLALEKNGDALYFGGFDIDIYTTYAHDALELGSLPDLYTKVKHRDFLSAGETLTFSRFLKTYDYFFADYTNFGKITSGKLTTSNFLGMLFSKYKENVDDPKALSRLASVFACLLYCCDFLAVSLDHSKNNIEAETLKKIIDSAPKMHLKAKKTGKKIIKKTLERAVACKVENPAQKIAVTDPLYKNNDCGFLPAYGVFYVKNGKKCNPPSDRGDHFYKGKKTFFGGVSWY